MLNSPVTSTFKFFAFLALLSLCAYGLYGAALYHVRSEVQDTLLSHFKDNDAFKYRRLSVRDGEVTLFGVSLDKDEFKTIERISLSYDPIAYLREGEIESITMLRPNFTIHIDDFSTESAIALPPALAPVIKIEQGQINFLGSILRDVIMSYDAVLNSLPDGGFSVQSEYKATQPHLSFAGQVHGTLTTNDKAQSNLVFSLDDLKIQNKDIHIRRSNGQLTIEGHGLRYGDLSMLAEINAGAARFYGFEWMNANMTFNGTMSDFTLQLTGKGDSNGETEFTYLSEKKENEYTHQGRLYSPNGQKFFQFLNRNDISVFHPDDQPHIYDMDQIHIDFSLRPLTRTLHYDVLSNEGQSLVAREIILSR